MNIYEIYNILASTDVGWSLFLYSDLGGYYLFFIFYVRPLGRPVMCNTHVVWHFIDKGPDIA